MKLEEVCMALADQTRRRLVSIVESEGPLSSKQAHQIFHQRYSDLRRESIYKALERLVSAEILSKEYQKNRGIVYSLCTDEILLNLTTMNACEQ